MGAGICDDLVTALSARGFLPCRLVTPEERGQRVGAVRRTDPDENTAVTEPEKPDDRDSVAVVGRPATTPEGLDFFRAGTYRFYANLSAS